MLFCPPSLSSIIYRDPIAVSTILFSLRCLPVRAALPFMMVIVQCRKESVLGGSLDGVFCGY